MSVNPEIFNDASNDDFIEDLGLIVGIEKGCSISSAEAHKTARELVSQGQEKNVYLVGDDPALKQVAFTVVFNKKIMVGDQHARLSLVMPYAEIETHTPYRRFLKRMVDVSRVRNPADPMLCAKLGEDTYLPLAKFAVEGGSEYCSYVQLGNEMTDEAVVMTTLDDRTSRQRTVEAIRTVFEEARASEHPADINDGSARSIIQKLTKQQAESYKDQLLEAQEAMLVRRCSEKMKEQLIPRKLNVVGEEGVDYSEVMQTRPLLQNCRLDSSYFAELVLANGNNGNDEKIFAVVRGDLAFPVATLFKDANKIVFEAVPNYASSKQRTELINLLLKSVRGEPLFNLPPITITPKKPAKETRPSISSRDEALLKRWGEFKKRVRGKFGAVEMKEKEYFFDPSNYNHTVPATFWYRRGLLHKDEGALDDPYKAGMTEWGVDNALAELSKFFEDPEIYDGKELPWQFDDPPTWLALSRLPLLRQAEQMLFDKLGVGQQIRSRFGKTNIEQERFVKQVQTLLRGGNTYRGTIDDVNTGTNKASIDIEARLTNEGTFYNVELYAKASAIHEQPFPPEPYMTLSFDTTGSISKAISDDEVKTRELTRKFSNTLKKITSKNEY